jgi:hypothetical protein
VQLIKLEEIENYDHELKLAKQHRSDIEYYFTITRALILFIQNHFPAIDILTYLDADLYFFSDLSPIYNEFKTHSIAIIERRFPEHLRKNKKFGKYNVGWLSFRKDRMHTLTFAGGVNVALNGATTAAKEVDLRIRNTWMIG